MISIGTVSVDKGKPPKYKFFSMKVFNKPISMKLSLFDHQQFLFNKKVRIFLIQFMLESFYSGFEWM